MIKVCVALYETEICENSPSFKVKHIDRVNYGTCSLYSNPSNWSGCVRSCRQSSIRKHLKPRHLGGGISARQEFLDLCNDISISPSRSNDTERVKMLIFRFGFTNISLANNGGESVQGGPTHKVTPILHN